MLTITIKGRPRTRKTGPSRALDGQAAASPLDDLSDRMAAALEEFWASQGEATQDEEAGHEFHGNQYTDVPSTPKPTTVKAKAAKAAVHELLSSGHPFTKGELMSIAGIKSEKLFSDYMAMLKNPKYAGSAGALKIQKMPNGGYQVVESGNAPAGAAKAAEPSKPVGAPKPPPVVAPAPKPKMMPNVSPLGIMIPKAAMPKAKADEAYAGDMEDATAQLTMSFDAFMAEEMGEELPDPHHAVMEFKHAKIAAMAQWQTNTTGVLKEPVFDSKVYEADKLLAKAMTISQKPKDVAQYVKEWKTNTQLEKAGKLKPGGGVPDPIPAGATKPMAKAMKSWHSDSPPPPAVPYAKMVPKGFTPISRKDVEVGGDFEQGISQLKSKLAKLSGTAVANKMSVEAKLTKQLKDKPHFSAMKAAYSVAHPDKSLENRLVACWAGSSGDGNTLACALQMAVQKAFSIPEQHVEKAALHALEKGEKVVLTSAATTLGVKVDTPEQLESFKSGLQEFVQAQHVVTQQTFKDAGITHVFIARGMKVKKATGKCKVKLQPASSFSANYQTARSFAGAGTVFMAKVPASQVLSTYLTGFGCSSEHEVVVMAHDDIQAFAVPASDAYSVPHALKLL